MVQEDDYLLTNQEILGGLKSALARGETLKDAMMTFYQAGYKKQEIEDAAKAYLYLQKGVSEVDVLKKSEQEKKPQIESEKESEKLPEIKNKESLEVKKTSVPEQEESKNSESKKKEKEKPIEVKKLKTEQKVSAYPVKRATSAKSKAITLSLVIILMSLLALLGGVLLFKEELIGFFNNMFS